MTEVQEGDLGFSFPAQCNARKYEEWSFYRNQFQSVAGGSKAVDMLCLDRDTVWLIEVKDYRKHPRKKAVDLGDEVASKVRDTLAGLAAASANANDDEEKELARRALATRRWRVALHLEQPRVRSRLRPRPFDVASILSKLRSKKLKAIDARPVVLNLEHHHPGIPWTVR